MKNLITADDVTDEILVEAVECALASDMMGNHPGIDWEYAYNMLEGNEGYFVTKMGNGADRKIRGAVRKARQEGRTE
ncbi:hypothetical protein LCGC14_0810050 [marine sediment metagenome]|uniref:Uncharacterized protein n=1 Tax=marine sediment metagenome TaxID=412755 RepID=A0A0F9PRJ3_9ZZZZ